MYPSPGQTGCSYTGSAGGPNDTEIPICAKEGAAKQSSAPITNSSERMDDLIFIVFLPPARLWRTR
jgi:hypothetical protein